MRTSLSHLTNIIPSSRTYHQESFDRPIKTVDILMKFPPQILPIPVLNQVLLSAPSCSIILSPEFQQRIDTLISDNNTRSTLGQLASQAMRAASIQFYTDGSLQKNLLTNSMSDMGLGWIGYIDNDLTDALTYQGRIFNWPSSTRAELAAIFTALLIAPRHANITINTDSQAAIDGIQAYSNSKNRMGKVTSRVHFKSTNSSLISNIFYLTHSLDLNVVYVKVKGHSNIEGNNIADRLADEAVLKGSSVILSSSQRYSIQHPIQWNTVYHGP